MDVINLMVNEYNIRTYGLDFMGYVINNPKELTYHHLIIQKKHGGKKTKENGAILLKKAHKYLHFIEKKDKELFQKITKELIKENRSGNIDLNILANINTLLLEFEKKNKVNEIYKNRFLRQIDGDVLKNINKYELKKNLHK